MSNTSHRFTTYQEYLETYNKEPTTDDTFTPDGVMEIVNDYVARRWNLDPATFIRPFWPGADYTAEDYTGRVVVDNPPFSLTSEVERFYIERGIPFFLFAHGMTCINRASSDCLHIVIKHDIKFTNGVTLPVAFVSNLPADNVLEYSEELDGAIYKLQWSRTRTRTRTEWPDYVRTVSRVKRDHIPVPKGAEMITSVDGRHLFGSAYKVAE